MTIIELFDKGGVIVWILLMYSVVALSIIIERVIHFLLMDRPANSGEELFNNDLSLSEAEQQLESLKGPEANVLRGIFKAWGKGVKNLESVASRLGSIELQRMERGFRTLSILGNTAPLLGLLGTIIGMIKAFMVIEVAGGRVESQDLAGGIWEAMLTTGVGLAVSIPVLLLLHFLEGTADRRAHSMRRYAMMMLEQLPHQEHAGDSSEAAHHRQGAIHAV